MQRRGQVPCHHQRHVVGLAVREHRGDDPLHECLGGEAGRVVHEVHEPAQTLVQDLAAALHQTVRVQHDRGALRERGVLLVHQRRSARTEHRTGLRHQQARTGRLQHHRRRVPGRRPAQFTAAPVEDQAGARAARRAVHAGGERVQAPQRLGGGVTFEQVAGQSAAQLAHDRRGRGALADHVADGQTDTGGADRDDLVPVAADLGVLGGRQVAGGGREAWQRGKFAWQQAFLQRGRDLVFALQQQFAFRLGALPLGHVPADRLQTARGALDAELQRDRRAVRAAGGHDVRGGLLGGKTALDEVRDRGAEQVFGCVAEQVGGRRVHGDEPRVVVEQPDHVGGPFHELPVAQFAVAQRVVRVGPLHGLPAPVHHHRDQVYLVRCPLAHRRLVHGHRGHEPPTAQQRQADHRADARQPVRGQVLRVQAWIGERVGHHPRPARAHRGQAPVAELAHREPSWQRRQAGRVIAAHHEVVLVRLRARVRTPVHAHVLA